MLSLNTEKFLSKYGMLAAEINPAVCSENMLPDMEAGLNGGTDGMLMIPTYLCNDAAVPKGVNAAVIDAGGTNFRCGLVSFNDTGYTVENLKKCKMPGIDRPCTWEDFVSFIADNIAPMMDKTDYIGFCFSYSAVITPEVDGIVNTIDKEVVITGCEGKYIAKSLNAELVRRGFGEKRIVIVNDTAAVLLGCSANLDKSKYSSFVGQVSGTGTNTCCIMAENSIVKLNSESPKRIIINMESGLFKDIHVGYFDRTLDEESNNPGQKRFEKLTAGVYLGELARLMLIKAGEDGVISAAAYEKAKKLGRIDTSFVDAWASGENMDIIAGSADDEAFIREISLELLERSARCMASAIIAIAKKTGAGDDPQLPLCDCAEGSLVQRSRHYLGMLKELLDEYGRKQCGKYIEIIIGNESTIPGSAAAALIN